MDLVALKITWSKQVRSFKLNEAMKYDRYENAKEATFFGWVFSNMRTYALLCNT